MIDKERALKFQKDMLALLDNVGADEFYELFKAKLLNKIGLGEIESETLRGFIRQVGRVFNPEFIKFVDKTIKAYADIQQLVNTYYQDIGPDVHRELEKIRAIERINLNQLGAYEADTLRQIAKQLRTGIRAGEKLDQLSERIAQIDDKAKTYAETLARTQLRSYGQAITTEKARLGNIFFYTYFGIIRGNSRQFCRALMEQSDPTFHVNDIHRMNNSQVSDVLINRGGFRCHHGWEPDPFRSEKGYKAVFFTLKDGNRTIVVARSSHDTIDENNRKSRKGLNQQ